MNTSSIPWLTPDTAHALQGMLRTEVGPELTGRELDVVEARFGFAFSVDHRVFLAAGRPRGSSRGPD
ncbi:hypothetical protein [Streptomyces sp. NPDC015350]|uniref:hypothetical protein n=1 Tax=Streptomyces sp. NPDC015350 TaxID=3364955 RepID=UPI0036F74855